MGRRRSLAAVLGVAAAVSVSLPMTGASAAGGAIVNGDFETDAVGSTVVTGWTFTNALVDLGVTSLGGCTSVDTSDYAALRGWADNAPLELMPVIPVGGGNELYLPGTTTPVWLDMAGGLTTMGAVNARQVFYGAVTDFDGNQITDFYVNDGGDFYRMDDVHLLTSSGDLAEGFYADVLPAYGTTPDPADAADDVPPATDTSFWNGDPAFTSSIVDADSAEDQDLAPTSQALELFSNMSADAYGYVAHGQAAVSEAFTTGGARSVSLDWAASGASDDYHVLGYVLNVDTCQQIEVLDSTGAESDWQTATVSLPAAGTYRFVFVAGTYDQSWGGAAGAVLYVDSIRATPVISGTGIDLEPLFGTGDQVAGAPIQLTGGGLLPNSVWTAELHSTPVTLATGFTDASGNFWMLSNLPATVEPGKHQIILTGTAPDGTPRVDTAWITVTAAGTIGYLSTVGEEGTGAPNLLTTGGKLATTGLDLTLTLSLGGLLAVAAGAAFVGARLMRQQG